MITANLFLAGAPKSGTSSVAYALASHSDIFMPEIKEFQYYSSDISTVRCEMVPDSDDEYDSFYSSAGEFKYRLDGSTQYLRSSVAIRRINQRVPDAKFIVVLRNPIDAVQALHMEALYSFQESERDFKKAWRVALRKCDKLDHYEHSSRGPIADHSLYPKLGMYHQQLVQALNYVSRNQILVLLYDDLLTEPNIFYEEISAFLGVKQFDEAAIKTRMNVSHKHRWPVISRFILSPPRLLSPAMLHIRKFLLKSDSHLIQTVKNYLNVKSQRAKISRDTHEMLVRYYSDEIKRLSDLIDRDLSSWLAYD